jgi:hypothetical protein
VLERRLEEGLKRGLLTGASAKSFGETRAEGGVGGPQGTYDGISTVSATTGRVWRGGQPLAQRQQHRSSPRHSTRFAFHHQLRTADRLPEVVNSCGINVCVPAAFHGADWEKRRTGQINYRIAAHQGSLSSLHEIVYFRQLRRPKDSCSLWRDTSIPPAYMQDIFEP